MINFHDEPRILEPDTAMSLVSRLPTMRSLQQSSSSHVAQEYQPWQPNSSQMFLMPITAKPAPDSTSANHRVTDS